MYSPEFQHLLDFLDSNPEYLQDMRTRLLMPDLIALPEQFAQLVGLVTELSASFHDFATATDRRLTSIETDVGVLKTDVSTLKEDVNTLKADVGTLKTDVGTLKTDVASLNGSDLENRARLNILNIAMNELALNRGRVLLATGRDTEPGFLATINAAEEADLITEQQADHVLVADIIIRARRAGDKQYVHAVFEVSRTIRLDDVTRAHSRADTVAAATGEPTIAAVVGDSSRHSNRRPTRWASRSCCRPCSDSKRRAQTKRRTPSAERRANAPRRIASVTPPNCSLHFNAAVLGAVRRLRW